MICEIDKNDISECAELICNSFLTVANEFNITKENAPGYVAFSTTKEKLSEQYANGVKMFSYKQDGKIVGYCGVKIGENKECELSNLCVSPLFRQQKIGEKLLKHSISYAESIGCTQVNISIVEENERLKNWYKKFGFIHTESKKFDFFPFTCGYMKKILIK